ncbi:MAG: serine/threonine-protein kinase [Sorangiineae bacterium]|nr:serine/threonine-protein kinase [Polyangiaceae bacterium]MEB2323517.1 serine/threonine-protein kinase [Sorangiineae bacterium]
MSDDTGQLIAGRYRLEQVVGRGGHSVVYRARDLEGGRDVAVKVLHESIAEDPEYTVRMVREQRVTAALTGTAAVRVLSLRTNARGVVCLVMELLEGQDLDEYLAACEARGERLSVAELVRLLGPIVDTLELAHLRGIVHRDLKPGNLFVLSERRGVRLLDFGLAKAPGARALTRDGMLIGSPSYIAPEIWRGELDADERLDVYSLGAIIFRALAGRVPFEGATLREKLTLVTSAPRPSLCALRPDLPSEVDEWVAQALAVEQGERFRRVRAMWNALAVALDAAEPSERAPSERESGTELILPDSASERRMG